MNTLQMLPSSLCRASISTIIARPLTVTQSAFTQIAILSIPFRGRAFAPPPIHFLHGKIELFADLVPEILPQLHRPFAYNLTTCGIKTIIDERASAKSLIIEAVKAILVITQVAHIEKLSSKKPFKIFLIHIDFPFRAYALSLLFIPSGLPAQPGGLFPQAEPLGQPHHPLAASLIERQAPGLVHIVQDLSLANGKHADLIH